jgi:AspBHI-like restriction endonuclease/restriction endonuclease
MSATVPFHQLYRADLHVDRQYEGGASGNVGDDPLQRLLPVGNQGGIRYKGSVQKDDVRLVVLYTSGEDPDWPDRLDPFTGTMTYFGDNKRPGKDLHDTQRRGNQLLRKIFDRAHSGPAERALVPPVLVFSKGERGRDVLFWGLAAPGSSAIAAGDDLVAVWRAVKGERFQNYRATFTVLDEAATPRMWIDEVISGVPLGPACPPGWRLWAEKGIYRPLVSERLDVRSRAEQTPTTEAGRRIIDRLHRYFSVDLGDPTRFEQCAVDLWRMIAPATGDVDVTRPWRDGGRDAVGNYHLGPNLDPLAVEFALEAKCYGPDNSVGVGDMSRLISRLRYRQFGVFVTTSHFNKQVYREVRQDRHPVVLVCGRDIVDVLRSQGVTAEAEVLRWLRDRYP